MKTMRFFKNSQKAAAAFMFATMLTMGFTACSDDDSEAFNEEVMSLTRAAGDDAYGVALTGSQRLKFERREFLSESTTFSFEYPTKSLTGEDILLSATLTAWTPAEPKAGDMIESVHIYNHITLTADRESPTTSLTEGDTQGLNMLKMICMEDYGARAGINVPYVGHCIVIAPDYEGYGLTKDRVHPYMVQELMGRQVTDAAIYGLALYRKELTVAGNRLLPMASDWRSFAIGYSQGGATSLATHRYIEENGLDRALHFQGSICGDGPHDLIATMRYYFDDNGQSFGVETAHRKGIVTMPVVLPLIIKGMIDSNPELQGYRLEDFLSQQFIDTGIARWIKSKDYSCEDIERMLVEQVENGLTANGRTYTPAEMAEMFEVTTVSTSWGTAKALHRAMAQNSLTTGWQPKHRIAFLHSKADMVVPYSNYLAFRDAHAADEGRLFKVWDDAFSTSDHVDGGFTFFVNLGMTHALAQQFQWLSE